MSSKYDTAHIDIRGTNHDNPVKPADVKLAHGEHPYLVKWHNKSGDTATINIDEQSWLDTFCEPYPGIIQLDSNQHTDVYHLKRADERVDGKYNYAVSIGTKPVTNLYLDTKK